MFLHLFPLLLLPKVYTLYIWQSQELFQGGNKTNIFQQIHENDSIADTFKNIYNDY